MKLFLIRLFSSFLLSNSLSGNLTTLSTSQNQKLEISLKEHNLNTLAKNLQNTKKKIKLFLYKNIGYVSVDEFLKSVKPIIKHEKIEHKFNDDKTTITLKSSKNIYNIEFNYKTQIITVSDYKIFTEILKDKERGEEQLQIEFKGLENKNLNKEFKYHLKNYNIEMLKDWSDVYLPIVLLNQIFLNESNIQVYFNQQDVNIFRFSESISDIISQVNLKMSDANIKNEIPKELKEFQYNYLSFLFNHYYAIKLNNNKSYKDYFKKYKTKIVNGTNDEHYLATKQLIADLDDPHSAYALDGFFNKSKDFNKTPIKISNPNNRSNKQIKLLDLLAKNDPSKVEYENNVISDDTYMISFKKFEEDSAKHIKNSLEQAQSKNVKNIIFNLTQNGGGYIGAAYEIMGFLTNNPFNVYTYNPLSKEQKVETIKSKYNKFNFDYYILTSPYSFSAGNIFPQIARDNNLAKIIGHQTFGGASAIGYSILPTGDIIQLSTNNVFTNKNFKSLEFGIQPDVKLKNDVYNNTKDLYDPNTLLELIKEAKKTKWRSSDHLINQNNLLIEQSKNQTNQKPKRQPQNNNNQTQQNQESSLDKLIKNKSLNITKNDLNTIKNKLLEINPNLSNRELIVELKNNNTADVYLKNNSNDKVTIKLVVIKEPHIKNSNKLVIILISSPLVIVVLLVSSYYIFKKVKNKK
ncbi:S41 family peptidase [Mycoplasma sp. HU2014]|uniref:S41 family peptidase n=1 Tax=Mycoplasma sp. HU2014 TaxID=1664275 RepID=UPI00067D6BD0|nr:S41 family peptidase [Mycoplasma sp. HU2014]KNG79668.1 peptidase S41 family protein [Mycoplasma sp. HU2014]